LQSFRISPLTWRKALPPVISHKTMLQFSSKRSPVMHTLTIFLAKLIGLYCVVMAGGMIINGKSALAAIDGMIRSPQLLLMSGIMALPAGLALVIGHNVWSAGPLALVVTLIGWLVLVKAIALIAVPQQRMLQLYRAMHYDRWFTIYMVATMLLGLILTLAAFAA
jgi:hypothetical protein